MKILVIGDWHNAHITAVCLASLGHIVQHATANDKGSTEALAGNYRPPALDVEEPGYRAMLEKAMEECRLTYDGPLFVIDRFDLVWIAIDTNEAVNPYPTIEAAQRFHLCAPRMVISSQVPIGTCRNIHNRIIKPVAYVPENMRLGDGIKTFLESDRFVIGATTEEFQHDIFVDVLNTSSRAVFCSLETAEMIKHATNTWLAMNISFANEISELGKPYDIDMETVTRALRMDGRIGPKAPLVAGGGYGQTLARDVSVLAVQPGATLVRAVQDVNRARPQSRAHAQWKKERT